MTRRHFGAVAGSALASFAFGAACSAGEPEQGSDGRITARPRTGAAATTGGARPLGLGRSRDGILQLPAKAGTDPLPLVVLFHGAGGDAGGIVRRLGAMADAAGLAVLAPDSRGQTWDAIDGGFGPDVTFLDRALAHVFETTIVDPARISAGGFSDGASYALSIALINGDLFRRSVAFSPGFMVDGPARGKPRVFISHGTRDTILPIDRCSRVIVPRLQRRGYDVTYKEFDGGHDVPADIARDGMHWATLAS